MLYLQTAQKEKAAKEAAAAEADATSDGKTIGDYVVSIFEIPPFSFLQGPLEPLLDTIRDNTIVASAVALGLASIPLFILSSLLSSKVAANLFLELLQYASLWAACRDYLNAEVKSLKVDLYGGLRLD